MHIRVTPAAALAAALPVIEALALTALATRQPAAAPQAAVAPTPAPRPSGPPAPGFEGGGAWINAPPLALERLRGKVVLVDFWTYGCSNCRNTLPALRDWWRKYNDQGLVIVGVHTPEFAHERDLANLRAAVARDGIGWPVVQDNDMRIWRAYGNRYWPRFYLIDHTGRIIYDHIGEGAYDATERQIVAALAAARDGALKQEPPTKDGGRRANARPACGDAAAGRQS